MNLKIHMPNIRHLVSCYMVKNISILESTGDYL